MVAIISKKMTAKKRWTKLTYRQIVNAIEGKYQILGMIQKRYLQTTSPILREVYNNSYLKQLDQLYIMEDLQKLRIKLTETQQLLGAAQESHKELIKEVFDTANDDLKQRLETTKEVIDKLQKQAQAISAEIVEIQRENQNSLGPWN